MANDDILLRLTHTRHRPKALLTMVCPRRSKNSEQ
jgi:hypothetical protein